jgi:hypothetical protein
MADDNQTITDSEAEDIAAGKPLDEADTDDGYLKLRIGKESDLLPSGERIVITQLTVGSVPISQNGFAVIKPEDKVRIWSKGGLQNFNSAFLLANGNRFPINKGSFEQTGGNEIIFTVPENEGDLIGEGTPVKIVLVGKDFQAEINKNLSFILKIDDAEEKTKKAKEAQERAERINDEETKNVSSLLKTSQDLPAALSIPVTGVDEAEAQKNKKNEKQNLPVNQTQDEGEEYEENSTQQPSAEELNSEVITDNQKSQEVNVSQASKEYLGPVVRSDTARQIRDARKNKDAVTAKSISQAHKERAVSTAQQVSGQAAQRSVEVLSDKGMIFAHGMPVLDSQFLMSASTNNNAALKGKSLSALERLNLIQKNSPTLSVSTLSGKRNQMGAAYHAGVLLDGGYVQQGYASDAGTAALDSKTRVLQYTDPQNAVKVQADLNIEEVEKQSDQEGRRTNYNEYVVANPEVSSLYIDLDYYDPVKNIESSNRQRAQKGLSPLTDEERKQTVAKIEKERQETLLALNNLSKESGLPIMGLRAEGDGISKTRVKVNDANYSALKTQADALNDEIEKLFDQGVDPNSPELKAKQSQYRNLKLQLSSALKKVGIEESPVEIPKTTETQKQPGSTSKAGEEILARIRASEKPSNLNKALERVNMRQAGDDRAPKSSKDRQQPKSGGRGSSGSGAPLGGSTNRVKTPEESENEQSPGEQQGGSKPNEDADSEPAGEGKEASPESEAPSAPGQEPKAEAPKEPEKKQPEAAKEKEPKTPQEQETPEPEAPPLPPATDAAKEASKEAVGQVEKAVAKNLTRSAFAIIWPYILATLAFFAVFIVTIVLIVATAYVGCLKFPPFKLAYPEICETLENIGKASNSSTPTQNNPPSNDNTAPAPTQTPGGVNAR